MKGAVAASVEAAFQEFMYEFPSRNSFGVVLNPPWVDYLHYDSDAFQDPIDGTLRVREQMKWLLRRGDLLKSGITRAISVTFELKLNPKADTVRHMKFIVFEGTNEANSLARLDPGRQSYILKSALKLSELATAFFREFDITYDLNKVTKDDCIPAKGLNGVKLKQVLISVKLDVGFDAHVSVWCNNTRLSSVILVCEDNAQYEGYGYRPYDDYDSED